MRPAKAGKLLDGTRTIPNDVDELQSNRNPLIDKASIPRKSYLCQSFDGTYGGDRTRPLTLIRPEIAPWLPASDTKKSTNAVERGACLFF